MCLCINTYILFSYLYSVTHFEFWQPESEKRHGVFNNLGDLKMPETDSDETRNGKRDNRAKSERRSDTDRRVVQIKYGKEDRRDKAKENRRSWVGRRQVADWRKK